MDICIEPTETAYWQALIAQAEQRCASSLEQDLESYLVFMLMRFMKEHLLADTVVAMDLLQSREVKGVQRVNALRDVGDKCLLFSGLFTGRAERRRVRISYFVGMGQTAYSTLAQTAPRAFQQLYALLSAKFVVLMDILQAVRSLGNAEPLSLLDAADLWLDTKSQFAKAVIKKSIPEAVLIKPISSTKN